MIRHWAYALDRHEPGLPRSRVRREVAGSAASCLRRSCCRPGRCPPPRSKGSPNAAACRSRSGTEPGVVHRRGRFHRHRGDQLRVRDRALSAPRRRHLGDAGVRGHLRREEDLAGHRPFRHVVVDLHRPERRSAGPAAVPGLPIQGHRRNGWMATQTGADGQPGHRVLLERAARPQAVDPAVQGLSGAASAAAADVPGVQLTRAGTPSSPPAAARCTAT